MTDRVSPSFNRDAESFDVATSIKYGGGSEWIKDGSSPTQSSSDEALSTGNFDAFSESHSSSSFDVDISAGEAFINGAWVARDGTTTVTLDSSTNNQTVYVGYDRDQSDTVLIGKSSAFGSGDPKVPIWEFDTDGSGVTTSTDLRIVGGQPNTVNRNDVSSTSYTAMPWESMWVDTSSAGGNVTITLPPTGALSDGDRTHIRIEDGTNNTDVAANTGQSITGDNPTLTQTGDSMTMEFKSSNTSWMVV